VVSDASPLTFGDEGELRLPPEGGA
jgi:hypothetical protein